LANLAERDGFEPRIRLAGVVRQYLELWSCRFTLRDLDQVTLMPVLNRSLAQKVGAIHIYANGYKLHEINRANFSIDETPFDPEIPAEFTSEELADSWVRIRSAGSASVFSLSFADQTPRRLFSAETIPDSRASRRKG
jgi:hypothetical protein